MANDLTTAKPPRALAVIDKPLVPITSALAFANALPVGRIYYQHLPQMVPDAITRIPVKLTRSRRGGSSCDILHEKVSVRKHRHVGIE